MTLDWINLITYAGLAFGAIVSFHFLTIKRPGVSIRVLGLYTLVLTLGLLEFVVDDSPRTLMALGSMTLLYGPLLYIYITTRLNKESTVKWRQLVHLTPFLLYLVMLVFAATTSEQQKGSELIDLVVYELVFVHIFSYCINAIVRLRRFKLIMTAEPEVDRMRNMFMKTLVIVSIALFGSSFIGTHIFIFTGVSIPLMFKFSIQIAMCVVLFIIALLNTESMHKEKMVSAY